MPAPPPPPAARSALTDAVSIAVAFVVARSVEVLAVGIGHGIDVTMYEEYAQQWASGGAPYRHFAVEYPPAAMLVFAAPRVLRAVLHGWTYRETFALEMAAFDLVATLGVWWLARLSGAARARAIGCALLYVAVTAWLEPVRYARFDLAPAALAAVALVPLWRAGDARFVAPALLGAAAALKIWPAAIAPLVIAVVARPKTAQRRRATWDGAYAGALFVAAAWLVSFPAGRLAGRGTLRFARLHAERGIGLESTWSNVVLALHVLVGHPATTAHEFGAYHVHSPLSGTFARLALPVTLALVAAPQALWWRRQSLEGVLPAATATVAGFLLGNKIFSPQFIVWLVPFACAWLAVIGRKRDALVVALALAVTVAATSLVHAYLFEPLRGEAPHQALGVVVLTIRHVALGALYALGLRGIGRSAQG